MRKSSALILVGCLLGVATPAAADTEKDPEEDVVVTIQDPLIVESSGLIARKGDFLTVNDSGDKGQVFMVDGKSGETIGVTFWSDSAKDVEGIAPADGKEIWIGDIGDNKLTRPWIEVTRLPVDEGDRAQAGQTFRLAYPKGSLNAESLLVNPVTGRLYVATKIPLVDGQLYEAPETLDPIKVNMLKPIGKVGTLLTDGAFFPDGRHVILRGYGRATIYTFPELEVVGFIDLPEQEQGEGIAVSPDGQIYISSEGTNQPVLKVKIPTAVRDDMGPTTTPSESTGSTPASPSDPADPGVARGPAEDDGVGEVQLLAGILAGVGALICFGWYVRARRG